MNIFKDQDKDHQMMEIINITPDSFSDGGENFDLSKNILKIKNSIDEGVFIFDIGAESTAPMNSPIDEEEELQRFKEYFHPLLRENIFNEEISFSIDTYRPKVFREVRKNILNHYPQAKIIWNDVSGVLDDEVFDILKNFENTYYIYCHNLVPKRERTSFHQDYIKNFNSKEDLLFELINYYTNASFKFTSAGIESKVYFDPCFGFAKDRKQNIWLLDILPKLISTSNIDQKWLIGISRKSFLQNIDPEKKSLDKREKIRRSEFLHSIYLSRWMSKLKKNKLTYRIHDSGIYFTSKMSLN